MSRGTLDPAQSHLLSHTGLSPSSAGFPKTVLLVGGLRASIYNAMPKAGVEKLVEFMSDFEKKNM